MVYVSLYIEVLCSSKKLPNCFQWRSITLLSELGWLVLSSLTSFLISYLFHHLENLVFVLEWSGLNKEVFCQSFICVACTADLMCTYQHNLACVGLWTGNWWLVFCQLEKEVQTRWLLGVIEYTGWKIWSFESLSWRVERRGWKKIPT